MIEAHSLTKRYGEKAAVTDLSFTVRPGIVTGFLGPNGAGKSTTMRMIVGLDTPSSGNVVINGKRYEDHQAPLHEVAVTAEHLIVIGRGRLIADTSVEEFTRSAAGNSVFVRTDEAEKLRTLLAGPDVSVASAERGALEVSGLTSERIGRIAADNAI